MAHQALDVFQVLTVLYVVQCACILLHVLYRPERVCVLLSAPLLLNVSISG